MGKLWVIGLYILALLLLVTPAVAGGKGPKAKGAGEAKSGHAQKAGLYTVPGCNLGVALTESAGRAKIVTPRGEVVLIIHGKIKDLTPDAEYEVWAKNLAGYVGTAQADGTFGHKLDTFTANAKGKGNFHIKIKADELPEGTYQPQVVVRSTGASPCAVAATQPAGVTATVKHGE